MSDFLKTAFDYESMQLKCLYRNEDIALVQTGIEDEHLRTVLFRTLEISGASAGPPVFVLLSCYLC